jgi:nitrous oxidase accessory protein
MYRPLPVILVCFGALALGLSAPADARPVSVIDGLIEAAADGAVIDVPAGTYEGSLVIRRPVTLDGHGVTVLDGLGVGSVVVIESAGVTLRGMSIRNSGEDVTGEPAGIRVETGPAVIEGNTLTDTLFGIDLRESPGSVIRGNSIVGKDLDAGRRGDGIRLWWSHGCTVEDNAVSRSRDMVFWYSEDLRITRNTVTDSRYGLHFMYSHNTVLSENDLAGNSVGVYLMYSNGITLEGNRMSNNRGASGYGIGLKDCDDIVVRGNALLANRVGAYIDNSPSSIGSTGLIESNMVAFNEIGLLATPNTHDNIVTGNAFIENEEPAATHGRGRLTNNTFSRDGVGNYWSDYAGFDLDQDGIGDVAYEPRSLFGEMLAREPNLRLFVHSPAQQAIEFTARALPELRPEATLIDEAPLATPPTIDIAIVDAPRSAVAMGLLAFGLLLGGCAAVFVVGRDRGLPDGPQGATA